MATMFPDYGFARHKGYPTKAHIRSLDRLGVTPIHRRSFAPVRDALEKHGESPAEQLDILDAP